MELATNTIHITGGNLIHHLSERTKETAFLCDAGFAADLRARTVVTDQSGGLSLYDAGFGTDLHAVLAAREVKTQHSIILRYK